MTIIQAIFQVWYSVVSVIFDVNLIHSFADWFVPWNEQGILAESEVCSAQRRASCEGLGLLARLASDIFTAKMVGWCIWCCCYNCLWLQLLNRIWLLVFLHLLFVNMVPIHNLADHLSNRFFVSTSHKQDFLFVISTTWFIYSSIKNHNWNLSIESNHSRNLSMTWDFEVWQILPSTSLIFKEWNPKMIISLLLLLATFFMINDLTRPFHCCWAMSLCHRYRWLSFKSWSSRLNSFVLSFHQSQ